MTESRVAAPSRPPAPAMAWVPEGTFAMGAEGFYPEEQPVHRVSVDGFWMDEHPVTVGEFRRFVKCPRDLARQSERLGALRPRSGRAFGEHLRRERRRVDARARH